METQMTKTLKMTTLGAALICALSIHARADDAPTSILELNDAGEAQVDGAAYKEQKQADVYADVVKVINGPDESIFLTLHPVEARKQNDDGTFEKVPMAKAATADYLPAPDWKLFDAEGAITEDPRFAIRVIMPFRTTGNAVDVEWNECVGNINGNYVGLPCAAHRGLSNDYMSYLKQNYLPTVNVALKAAGLSPAVSVHIEHDGTMGDARHRGEGGSLHVAGRAIDQKVITTTDADGNKHSFDFTKTNTTHKLSHSCAPAGTQNCQFFEAFRKEWARLQTGRSCHATSIGLTGTIGWEDKDHIAHHLHTSMPFCPNSKGWFITDGK
jgi:hypothetical protein